jgi:hypothetical protein
MSHRDLTEQDLDIFASAVGMLTLRWGSIEGALNMMLAVVYQAAGGKHLEPELPYMLTTRIRFMRRCFRQIEALDPFSESGVMVLDAVADIARTREIIAHGYLAGVTDDPITGYFTSIRPDKAKTMHRQKTTPLTLKALVETANKSGQVALACLYLCNSLGEAFVSKYKRA